MTDLEQQLREAEAAEAHFASIEALQELAAAFPDKPEFRYRLALKHLKVGAAARAEELLRQCHDEGFDEPLLKVNLGHALKALGRTDEAAEMYRETARGFDDVSASIAAWSLADLKSYRFTEQETVLLQGRTQITEAAPGCRALMLFALAIAREQQNQTERAFTAMSEANLILSELRPFRAEQYYQLVQSLVREVREPAPPIDYDGPVPIFVVGMPRSGTTLVEQILACHSDVEATDELPFLERFGLGLEEAGGYAKALALFTPEQQRNFAARYLENVAPYRAQGLGHFIDKNPSNFLHIGLIKAIFPNARIINVVRDTLDNAMSVFKQYFHRGNDFSYSLQGIIYYWQGYVTLMRHWEQLYPGDVLHLAYESLVREPETKIREMLEYCGLAEETACFRFWESDRPVLTPSASQVRNPISAASIGSGLKYQSFIKPRIPALAEITRRVREVLPLS
jgi:tetratricopeptide (TPR) repeat protein